MKRTIVKLGGQKIQTVELLLGQGRWNPLILTTYRPWYEGSPKRSGKYTKKYKNGRQKLRRRFTGENPAFDVRGSIFDDSLYPQVDFKRR